MYVYAGAIQMLPIPLQYVFKYLKNPQMGHTVATLTAWLNLIIILQTMQIKL